MRYLTLLFIALAALSQSSCFQVKAKEPVVYQFDPGRTALLKDGHAYAPKKAPKQVIAAIAAGNRLQGKPYKWGGGHRFHNDSGYDCSGTVSYVLREAGIIKGSMPSKAFLNYGKRGEGKWITIYSRNGHVFMTIAGLRLDTGGDGSRSGPKWKPWKRGVSGYIMRHPPGL